MYTLPEAFFMASGAGIWLPTHWTSKAAKAVYKIYMTFTVAVMLLLMVSQFVFLCFLTDNMDDFAEAACVFLTGFNACIKSINILCRRNRVIDLANMLREQECIPRNVEEAKLISHFDRISRYAVLFCMVLAEFTAACIGIWPLVFAREKFKLALRAWHPYDINSGLAYWCSFVHQFLGLLTMAAWNATNDVIITGFMIHACAQLELMIFRLQVLPKTVKSAISRRIPVDVIYSFQKKVIRQSVEHHIHIFRFTEYLKSSFAPSIFIQYLLSTGVLCLTIYEMTVNKSDTAQMLLMLLYLSSMLVEFLMYCWFGNEVTLKSLEFTEAIVKADWTELHVDTLKGLLIMMLQSTTPILMNCGPFITLSVNSYTSILKLSYSAFNVLQ